MPAASIFKANSAHLQINHGTDLDPPFVLSLWPPDFTDNPTHGQKLSPVALRAKVATKETKQPKLNQHSHTLRLGTCLPIMTCCVYLLG